MQGVLGTAESLESLAMGKFLHHACPVEGEETDGPYQVGVGETVWARG